MGKITCSILAARTVWQEYMFDPGLYRALSIYIRAGRDICGIGDLCQSMLPHFSTKDAQKMAKRSVFLTFCKFCAECTPRNEWYHVQDIAQCVTRFVGVFTMVHMRVRQRNVG